MESQLTKPTHEAAEGGELKGAPRSGGLAMQPPSFNLTSAPIQRKTADERLSEISGKHQGGKALSEAEKIEAKSLINSEANKHWRTILPEVQALDVDQELKDVRDAIATAETALAVSSSSEKGVRLQYLRTLKNLSPTGSGLKLFVKYLKYRQQVGALLNQLKALGEQDDVKYARGLMSDLRKMGDVNTYVGAFIRDNLYRKYQLSPATLKTKGNGKAKTIAVKGKKVSMGGGQSKAQRDMVKAFLKDVLKEEKEKKGPSKPSRITQADLRGIAMLMAMKKKDREAILKLIRGKVSTALDNGTALTLEEIVAHADVKHRLAQHDELKFEEGEAPSEKPKVQRPVRGKVLPDTKVGPNQEISFQFQETDLVDDLRVPRIQIQWRAVRNLTGGVTEQIDKDTSSYIPLRGHNPLSNDSTFKVKFKLEGSYTIFARVHHNFYKGVQLVEHPIQVVNESKRLDKMAEKDGMKNLEKEDFNFESASNPYDEGKKLRGDWDPKTLAKAKGKTGFFKLGGDIHELKALVRKYKKEGEEENSEAIKWAEERIETLEEYREDIAGSVNGTKSKQVGCMGHFASRKQGVPDQPLSLSAFISQSDMGQHTTLKLKLFDLTEAEDTEQFTFEESLFVRAGESREEGYEKLWEKAFVRLTEAYPNGTLRLYTQGFKGDKLNNKMVGFERVTDTVGKDIINVAYSAPVKFAVDVASAAAMLFPPTAPLGMAVGLIYNGAEVAYNLAQDADQGTAGLKNAVEVGALALELIPVLGKAMKVGTAGRFVQALKAVGGVAGAVGTGYLLTEGVWRNLKTIQEKDIGKLVALEKEMSLLHQHKATPALLATKKREVDALKKQIRFNTAAVISEAVVSQGLTMASKKFILRLAQGRAGQYKEHKERMKSADPVLQKGLPKDLVKDIPVIRDPVVHGNEVRVYFDTDGAGTVRSIAVRVSETADAAELAPLLKEHHSTIRLLKRYQGVSGAIRLLIARKFGKDAMEGNFYEPGDLRFEATGEVAKLAKIIKERKAKLKNGNLGVGDNGADAIRGEIELLELHVEKHKQRAESGEQKAGVGYIASPSTRGGKHTAAAMRRGYPDPAVHAPGHHYREDGQGGYKLVPNPNFTGTRKMLNRTSTGWNVVDDPMSKALLNMKPGEIRTHANGSQEKKNPDGTIWIFSKAGRTSTARKGYEHMVLPSPGQLGLKEYERAHSQGKITGWESAQGILYAPKELNQEYQRKGIEGFFRAAAQEMDDGINLYIGTETTRHPGTSLLQDITYVMFVGRDGEKPQRIMEVGISVSKNTNNPRISVSKPIVTGKLGPYMKD